MTRAFLAARKPPPFLRVLTIHINFRHWPKKTDRICGVGLPCAAFLAASEGIAKKAWLGFAYGRSGGRAGRSAGPHALALCACGAAATDAGFRDLGGAEWGWRRWR